MCGRYVLEIDSDGLMRAYAAQPARDFDWGPVYSIAPRTKPPVIRAHFGDAGHLRRTLGIARWGFCPSWAHAWGPSPMNARYETASLNVMIPSSFAPLL